MFTSFPNKDHDDYYVKENICHTIDYFLNGCDISEKVLCKRYLNNFLKTIFSVIDLELDITT